MKITYKFCVLVAAVVSIFLVSFRAKAQTYSGSETLSLFGTFDQNNTAVTKDASVACVETSIANALVYLNNVYASTHPGKSPLGDGTPTYTTVNALGTAMGISSVGTYYGNEATGLKNYLGPTGGDPSPQVAIAGGQYVSSLVGTGVPTSLAAVVNNTTPTAAFLASALNAKQAVTVWIQWGSYNSKGVFSASGGLESVTLTSISVTSGKGSMSFIDPWGSATSTGKAVQQNNIGVSTVGGYLYLQAIGSTTPTGSTGTAPYAAGSCAPPTGICGRIVADLDLCLVPEPSTFLAGALLLLPFVVSHFRKSRRTSKTAG